MTHGPFSKEAVESEDMQGTGGVDREHGERRCVPHVIRRATRDRVLRPPAKLAVVLSSSIAVGSRDRVSARRWATGGDGVGTPVV